MKKIMFSDKYGLTKAVLEGRKTHTRRILHCPKTFGGKYVSGFRLCTNQKGSQFAYLVDEDECEIEGSVNILSAYKFGEEVAVAQSYQTVMRYYHSLGNVSTRVVSEEENTFWNAMRNIESTGNDSAMQGDNNKMFVRADLMPHRIKINNIRIERLQDISEEDCLKEGIKRKNKRYVIENEKGVCFYTNDVILAFRYLIDKTCGKGTWRRNPYVFVYDFELIK